MKKMVLLSQLVCFVLCAHAQYKVVKKSLIDIGLVNNTVASMVTDSAGKIIVVGSVQEGSSFKLCILRYKANGTLDATFSNDGIDTFSVQRILPAQYQGASLTSVTVQPDGKIIAAGYAWYLSGVNYLSNTLVMRLNKNGSLDSAFGDSGTVRTNINSSTGLSVDEAHAVQLQQDGKIVIAGSSYDYIQYRFLAIRYNENGSPDTKFGSGGATLVTIGASDDKAFALAIQTDGKLVLAGESYLSGGFSYRVAVVRLKTTGTPDNNFGTNGIVTTNIAAGGDVAKAVAIQTDGKIIIGGFTQNVVNAQNNLLCIRYRSNGNIDSSFGNAGKVIIDIAGRDDIANNLIIQPDNKILLGGYSVGSDNTNYFLTMRLLADGTKDSSYADDGIQTTNFFQQDAAAYGMSLLDNGKILLAGQLTNGAGKYVSVVRYKKNGKIDSAFANNGDVISGIGSSEDIAYKMLRVPWQKNALLLAGTANGYWVIAKYNSNTLMLDSSFGLNGVVSVNYKNPNDPGDEPSLAIDAQTRKIYLAGYTGSNITIVRFNKNGVKDPDFGKNGVVNYGLSIYYGGFGLQTDHKILLAGVRQFSTSGYDFIARLKTDGSADSSFGDKGEVQHLPVTPTSIQMKNDGRNILLGGRVPQGFNGAVGVLSLNLDGSPDTTFGENGLVYKKSSNANAQVYFKYNMAQDQMGHILLSGGVQGANFNFQFSVTRFLKNGIVDSSFANNGLFVKDVASQNFNDDYNEGISAYCVGSNCSAVTAGINMNDFNEQSHSVVIALKDDGAIDSLNNSTGYIDTAFYNDKYEAAYSALIDTVINLNEIIFIAGKASNGNNSDFELIKITKPFGGNTIEPLFISKNEKDMYENRRSFFAVRN
ncbi:MAG: hypothetical protein JO072_01505 [Parafilimonas sp.]|nr:hypothetical protein [Parafilimonas sp.]